MQLQLFHQFFCILLKATGFPTILYNSNHVQTRERFEGDQAKIGGNARVAGKEFGQSVGQVTVRNKSTKENQGTVTINCYFATPSGPQPVDFDNLLSMASASDEEDPVAPPSWDLFCKDAFVENKPGYQPSRLPEAPFFLSKCKNNVKASERKLTVFIYFQDQLLPFNFVDAQL